MGVADIKERVARLPSPNAAGGDMKEPWDFRGRSIFLTASGDGRYPLMYEYTYTSRHIG